MNDMSEAPKLWARKGETITCTQGHDICEVSADIATGQGRSARDFVNWRQIQPDHQTKVNDIRCRQCGGSWVNGNLRDGYQFHFKDGWR